MENRYRNIQVKFRVTDKEKELIEERMKLCGVKNQTSFVRKMALDGYIINFNVPELERIISLLRYSSNNINQIATKVNATGTIFKNEIEEIKRNQAELWSMLDTVIAKFSKIK